MTNEHILVVDDEAHIRMSLFILLRDAGYRVTTVQEGWDAAKRLSSSKMSPEPIDLILTDVHMPGLDGIALIDQNLCTQCEACVATCPVEAIKVE